MTELIMTEEIRDQRSYIRRLENIVDAVKHLNSTLKLDELLSVILHLALENLNSANGTIYLVDRDKQQLTSKVLDGVTVVEITLPIGTGIAGTVAQTGETINLTDVGSDARFFGAIDKKSGFTTKTMLCMPMRNREQKIIGVFQLINKNDGYFDEHDESFLKAFSEHAAIAVENARLHEVLVAHARVRRELQIAAEIQQRLLPEKLPAVAGYELASCAVPCAEV
jgi:phosphoserine phosphatase RsbU/P